MQFLKDYSSDDPNLYKIFTEPKVLGLMQISLDDLRKERRNGVTRADIAI
jgi:hypothetical protein